MLVAAWHSSDLNDLLPELLQRLTDRHRHYLLQIPLHIAGIAIVQNGKSGHVTVLNADSKARGQAAIVGREAGMVIWWGSKKEVQVSEDPVADILTQKYLLFDFYLGEK